jgi:hypothetical protein
VITPTLLYILDRSTTLYSVPLGSLKMNVTSKNTKDKVVITVNVESQEEEKRFEVFVEDFNSLRGVVELRSLPLNLG